MCFKPHNIGLKCTFVILQMTNIVIIINNHKLHRYIKTRIVNQNIIIALSIKTRIKNIKIKITVLIIQCRTIQQRAILKLIHGKVV